MDRPQYDSVDPASKACTSPRLGADLKPYLDGELSLLARWWVGRHIGSCTACREEIAVLERLGKELHAREHAVPRAQLRTRILASLPETAPNQVAQRQRAAMNTEARWSARRPVLALGSMCAVLLLMLGASALNHRYRPAETAALPQTTLVQPTSPATNRVANSPGGSAPETVVSAPALPHRATDPFAKSLPDDSTDRSAAVQASTESTGTSASTRSSSRPVSTNTDGYTDPTSREAELLAAAPTSDKLREKHQIATAGNSRSIPMIRNPQTVKNRMPEPTRIALAVSNVDAARRQVQEWATAAGATVTVVTAGSPFTSPSPEHSFETSSASGQPATNGTTSPSLYTVQRPTMLKLRVPVQRADSFTSQLNQMGAPVLTTNIRGSKGTLQRLPIPVQPSIIQPRMTDNVPLIDEKSRTGKEPATITIFLRLQPGEAPR